MLDGGWGGVAHKDNGLSLCSTHFETNHYIQE